MDVEQTEVPKTRSRMVTWGPVAAILISVIAYIGAQLVASLVASIYGAAQGWDEERIIEWITSSTNGLFLVYAISQICIIVVVLGFLRFRKTDFLAIGLTRPALKDIPYALGGYIVYFPLYLVALGVIKVLVPSLDLEQEQQLGFGELQAPPEFVFVFIALVILPPLAEEILMRGFLYSGLKTKLPVIASALLTSFIFAMLHLQFGSDTPLLWVAAIDTFILSLVLIYLREKTGRLWASIGLHAVKNFIAYLVVFVFADRL